MVHTFCSKIQAAQDREFPCAVVTPYWLLRFHGFPRHAVANSSELTDNPFRLFTAIRFRPLLLTQLDHADGGFRYHGGTGGWVTEYPAQALYPFYNYVTERSSYPHTLSATTLIGTDYGFFLSSDWLDP